MTLSRPRRGVASVIGTMFFVLVFMLALGSMAYVTGLQSQVSQADRQAQALVAAKGAESVSFVGTGPGVAALNDGPASVTVNRIVFRFPNGTVYPLSTSASVPPGGSVPLSALVPGGCSEGGETCAAMYSQIVSGSPPGSSVGVVTSFGNVFWFTSAATPSGWNSVEFDASGNWSVPSGVSTAFVICIGGGGGGGGTGGATYLGGRAGSGGGGGGGVGSFVEGFVDLSGIGSVQVTVGKGGAGGSAGGANAYGGMGGEGGVSEFGPLMACGGGQGGGGGAYSTNAASGTACTITSAPGGGGGGIPGGTATSGAAADAPQYTVYGGGGGGGGSSGTPPGQGSPSSSLVSGVIFTGAAGASGVCAKGGGGGSASPFGDGGGGGSGATGCASGTPGSMGTADTGAGGGGAGGSYSSSSSCGTSGGANGGAGGSGRVVVYFSA